MFVETITSPRADWEHWNEKLRFLSEPPEALISMVAWESDEEQVTAVHVWDSPDAIAEFFMERVLAIVEAEGEPENKPERLGEPVAVYARGAVVADAGRSDG